MVKSRAQRRKVLCFMLKGSNKNVPFPRTKSKIRCEGQVSRRKYLLRQRRKRLHQQACKVCMGEKVANLKKHKNEINAQAFHSCTIVHYMTYCIRYMFSYLKCECRMKKGLAPDKSFRKTFGEKEDKF